MLSISKIEEFNKEYHNNWTNLFLEVENNSFLFQRLYNKGYIIVDEEYKQIITKQLIKYKIPYKIVKDNNSMFEEIQLYL